MPNEGFYFKFFNIFFDTDFEYTIATAKESSKNNVKIKLRNLTSLMNVPYNAVRLKYDTTQKQFFRTFNFDRSQFCSPLTYSGARLRINKAPFMIWNEVTLTGKILPLKCCYSLEISTQFFKKIRSFDAENLGSVGQRTAKLPAIKIWEWFDPTQTRLVRVGPGSVSRLFLRSPTLTASNYAAL